MTNYINVIAWDTATSWLSVAVIKIDLNNLNSYQILFSAYEKTSLKHSKILASTVEKAMKEAGLSADEISLVAVGSGPGSFTGLRTGLAVAKGLAMGLEKPLITISTLRVLAFQQYLETKNKFIASVIDARHNEVFISLYEYLENDEQKENIILEAQALKPELVLEEIKSLNLTEDVLLVGPSIGLLRDGHNLDKIIFSPKEAGPNSVILGCLAAEKYKNNTETNSSPLYIRKPDIWNN